MTVDLSWVDPVEQWAAEFTTAPTNIGVLTSMPNHALSHGSTHLKIDPGVYGPLDLRKYPSERVWVDATGCTFKGRSLIVGTDSALAGNFVIYGATFDPDLQEGDARWTKALYMNKVKNVALVNCTFRGTEWERGYGIDCNTGLNVAFVGCAFHTLNRGLLCKSLTNVFCVDNHFHDLYVDATNWHAIKNLIFRLNWGGDHHSIPDHCDFFQGICNDGFNENWLIGDDRFIEAGETTQGYFLGWKETNAGYYKNIVMRRLVYWGSSYHGITIEKVDGALIEDCTVIQDPSQSNQSWINVKSGSTDVKIRDTISTFYGADVEQYDAGNNWLLSWDPESPMYVETWLNDPINQDFRPIEDNMNGAGALEPVSTSEPEPEPEYTLDQCMADKSELEDDLFIARTALDGANADLQLCRDAKSDLFRTIDDLEAQIDYYKADLETRKLIIERYKADLAACRQTNESLNSKLTECQAALAECQASSNQPGKGRWK